MRNLTKWARKYDECKQMRGGKINKCAFFFFFCSHSIRCKTSVFDAGDTALKANSNFTSVFICFSNSDANNHENYKKNI